MNSNSVVNSSKHIGQDEFECSNNDIDTSDGTFPETDATETSSGAMFARTGELFGITKFPLFEISVDAFEMSICSSNAMDSDVRSVLRLQLRA